jgi:hypothetical protein
MATKGSRAEQPFAAWHQPQFANAVTLRGNVASPIYLLLPLQLLSGMRLSCTYNRIYNALSFHEGNVVFNNFVNVFVLLRLQTLR